MKPILTVKDVAELLQVSTTHVYNIMNLTDFPVIHVGRRKLVKYTDLMDWLEKQKHTQST
ncbi:helix-turn-helix domain-containing protein [Neobacillus jeddahensis]|uniref:helix-turn-helix domain-containing protein n=1 Tax=Neobacillus jeddahensis TaxID=1461580 RepID=UPI0005A6F204|nr:helix-turn-helix domain-containing protein [Neobacillus jeddahensis]